MLGSLLGQARRLGHPFVLTQVASGQLGVKSPDGCQVLTPWAQHGC